MDREPAGRRPARRAWEPAAETLQVADLKQPRRGAFGGIDAADEQLVDVVARDAAPAPAPCTPSTVRARVRHSCPAEEEGIAVTVASREAQHHWAPDHCLGDVYRADR